MAEGDVVLPLCRTSLGVIPGLTGYLDSRSGSGMTAVVWLGMTAVVWSGMTAVVWLGMTVVMCNVLLAVATREWLLGFVP